MHDSKVLEETVDAIPPLRLPHRQRGRPRKHPTKLHADKGYDYPRCRQALCARGIIPRIARGVVLFVWRERYPYAEQSRPPYGVEHGAIATARPVAAGGGCLRDTAAHTGHGSRGHRWHETLDHERTTYAASFHSMTSPRARWIPLGMGRAPLPYTAGFACLLRRSDGSELPTHWIVR